MDKLQKAKRWFARAAIIVAIFAILITLLPKLPADWSLASLTGLFSTKPTVWSYNLEGGEWSGWIVTPSGSDYIIDVETPVQVCYWDDPGCVKPYTAYPASYRKPIWLPRGLNRQSFKLLSPVDTTATVTIQER